MKLVSEISVVIEGGTLAELVEAVEGFGCGISRLEKDIENSGDEKISCTLEVVYSDRGRFQKLLQSFSKKKGPFFLKEVRSSLEEYIDSGLVEISGRIPLEKVSDYETTLLGAAELMKERIREGDGSVSCGIRRNVVQVVGVTGEDAVERKSFLPHYCVAETDALLINRFSSCRPYPLVCSLNQSEDIIRIVKSVEQTYGAARIISVAGASLSLYEQLAKEVSIPILFRETDEIPLLLMSMVLRMAMKNRLQAEETTIGIIGINLSAIRLTRLLRKYRFARILGYDTIEKILLNFENEGGLATTTENIFSNTDIVLFLEPVFTKEDLRLLRPGQFIINMTGSGVIDPDYLREQGVRDILQGDIYDLSRITPGLLSGIIEYHIRGIDDTRLIELSRKMGSMLTDDYVFPDLFGTVHSMVSDFCDPTLLTEKK